MPTASPALLREPGEGAWTDWSAPLSLREVEPEVLLQIDRVDRSLEDAPAWEYWNDGKGEAP